MNLFQTLLKLLQIGDVLQVWVLDVDLQRKRISLTCKEMTKESIQDTEKRRQDNSESRKPRFIPSKPGEEPRQRTYKKS